MQYSICIKHRTMLKWNKGNISSKIAHGCVKTQGYTIEALHKSAYIFLKISTGTTEILLCFRY